MTERLWHMSIILNNLLKKIPPIQRIFQTLDNQKARDEFVINSLKEIPAGQILLDAGCGSQIYRKYCDHLIYKAQDLGKFEVDLVPSMTGFKEKYQYGKIDYVGNIWDIDADNDTFDVILCTEVFEHIAYPIETIKEFSRLLKSGGKLILTAPSNCLRHMDPYFFYSGFSNRWYEKILPENKLKIDTIVPQGDYFSWMRAEVGRTMLTSNFFTALLLYPAFLFFSLKNKTAVSTATLCEGYYIIATKQE